MSFFRKHQKPSFARRRAGAQNLARRVDRRSYASCCVSSRRVCNESRSQTEALVTKLARRFHRNQQYSIIAMTNGGGTITERYAYDAYGTSTTTDAAGTTLTTSADNNRYTYTGREYDEALGLYHYRARMYDSVAGRFCSRDPIGFEGGFNIYSYVGGHPLVYLDPTGEMGIGGWPVWPWNWGGPKLPPAPKPLGPGGPPATIPKPPGGPPWVPPCGAGTTGEKILTHLAKMGSKKAKCAFLNTQITLLSKTPTAATKELLAELISVAHIIGC